MKIESYLPIFKGFYNSIFQFDDEMEIIDDYNQENGTNLSYDDFEFDYEENRQRVSKAITDVVGSELSQFGIKVLFQELVSPKYYNYTNDSINVEYTLTEKSFDYLKNYLIDYSDEFEAYLKHNYTSCEGFISFYSNDSLEWFNEYLKKDSEELKHIFGSVLNFILLNEEVTEQDIFDKVYEEIRQIDYTIKK